MPASIKQNNQRLMFFYSNFVLKIFIGLTIFDRTHG